MTKLIIDNQSALTDEQALEHIMAVVKQGKISNDGKQYCFATRFPDNIIVYSILNRKSERLVIYRERAR